MNRSIKLLGIGVLLFFTASFSVAQQDGDSAPTLSRSIGINVSGIFSSYLPEVMYLHTVGNRTTRLRGQVRVSYNSIEDSPFPCGTSRKSQTTQFSPHIAWGRQWGKSLSWARFYYGFELRTRYAMTKVNSEQLSEDCNANETSLFNSHGISNQLELGAAGVFGIQFQLTKRFSIALESDIAGNIATDWGNSTRSVTRTDSTGTHESTDRAIDNRQISTGFNALRSIRLFANLHF